MAEKELVAAIGKKYESMSRGQRIRAIRGLSEDGLAFMLRFFPWFYAEAFPGRARAASGPRKSGSRPALSAKPR